MSELYGVKRVMEPFHVLPTSAWKLDNGRTIFEDELRLSIKKIHLEGTSFKQICTEANENDEKIKQKIIDIIIKRGKLHNPVTDTGGLVFGTVEEIGKKYRNNRNLKVGDLVICNASLASVPMYIENIHKIDRVFNQIEADGYVICHEGMQVLKLESEEMINMLLFALDESGTLFRLDSLINDEQKRFLIVGNNMITNLLFGYVIRRKVGQKGEIICVLDKRTGVQVTGEGIDRLHQEVFNQVMFLDILKPTAATEKITREGLFDLSVNCAEIPGAETINVLSTREGGTVLFANLINNLNIALYITESFSKNIDLRSAEGFLYGYDDFDIQVVTEIYHFFENAKVYRVGKEVSGEPVTNPYNRSVFEKSLLEDFVCVSASMQAVLDEIMKVSKYDCNVIIFGETGAGKEKVANLIQKNSDRKMQPFVKINCGAISPSLIESEFFGYEKGAFTGANNTGKKGFFELANNGVMFLDEIGELPLEMQAKLLRVIQDGEFYRVGGTSPVKTNVRILSATNRDLEQFVEEGKFRRDLYYRLNVVPIKIPPLSERTEDIPALVNHFLLKYGKKFNIDRGITATAMDYLKKHTWPGNIRELENTVQRLLISAEGHDVNLMNVMKELQGEDFKQINFTAAEDELSQDKGETNVIEVDLQKAVDDYEKGLIKYACEKFGSTRKAAKALGISQTQIVRKKKKYDIE